MRRHVHGFERAIRDASVEARQLIYQMRRSLHEHVPVRARAVVIGCGIVGNSLVVPPDRSWAGRTSS